jgi:DNA repair photolyase
LSNPPENPINTPGNQRRKKKGKTWGNSLFKESIFESKFNIFVGCHWDCSYEIKI